MKNMNLLLTIVLLISIFPLPAMAQDGPDTGWSIGWEEEFGEGPWKLSENGKLLLEFWAENNDPFPIEINLDFEAELNASIDMPETINIGAQSNTTTEIEVENVTVLDHLAGTLGDFAVIATRASPIDGSDVTVDPQNSRLEGQIEIPRIADLQVELVDLGFTVTAGSTTTMEVILTNNGNMRDKVVSPTLIANGCPQLSLSGIDNLDNLVVDSEHDGSKNPETTTEITLSPASSHPSKKCTIEIAVVSDGGGGTSISTQEVEIKSSESSENNGGTGDSNGDSNQSGTGDGDDGSEITTGYVPFLSMYYTLMMILFAAFASRRQSILR